MEVNIVKPANNLPEKIRVAAYARVSTGTDEMLGSLSTQVSHYQSVISSNPDFLFAGIYTDEAKTGTKSSRPGLQELISKARSGEVDLILVKSVSRFARNAVDLLSISRELASLNVDIYFEEQDIHSISTEGELMLSLWASFAQEESRSMSENIKWKIRNDMRQGLPPYNRALGYIIKERQFKLIPEEAETVRIIYKRFLSGEGSLLIARYLNENGYKNVSGKKFTPHNIMSILNNYTYTSNLLLQKTYRENHITKKKRKNNGELTQYHIRNHHEGIVSLGDFVKVQELIAFKNAKYQKAPKTTSAFTGMIVCRECGGKYCRRTNNGKYSFLCRNRINRNTVTCTNKQIPEYELYRMSTEVLGLKEFKNEFFKAKIEFLEAFSDNSVVFHFKGGEEKRMTWKYKSRSESWTKEMKEKAKTYARRGR